MRFVKWYVAIVFLSSELFTIWFQANGDCNAKLGVTILGTINLPFNSYCAFLKETLFDLNVDIVNPGEAVNVEDEVVVVNSIVLPNKTLNVSVQEEIILWLSHSQH